MLAKRRGLNGDAFDFWLLGGGSLLFWAALAALYWSGAAESPFVQGTLIQLFVFLAFLELFVNLPHFLISYRLAYAQGSGFIQKNHWQLVWTPLALGLLLLLSAGLAFEIEYAGVFERPVRNMLKNFGLRGANSGLLLLAFLFIVQYTAVAWHYSKQAFGVALFRLYAIGQPLEPREARWLKLSLLCVWLSYFTLVAGGDQIYRFGELTYRSLGLPPFFHVMALGLIPFSLASNFWLLRKAARRRNQTPDLSACGSVFSVYCWFVPPLYARVPGFFVTVSPFFHSLQYLSFAARYEINSRAKHQNWKRLALVMAVYFVTVFAGWLLYRKVPTYLDSQWPLGTAGFFAAQAYVFLNLHHYMIDNAIWRGSNPEIRGKLST